MLRALQGKDAINYHAMMVLAAQALKHIYQHLELAVQVSTALLVTVKSVQREANVQEELESQLVQQEHTQDLDIANVCLAQLDIVAACRESFP